MGIIRWKIYEQATKQFQKVSLTYGYLTKQTRIENGLEKSHMMDARCISGHPCAESCGTWYLIKWVRRNNRQLHKSSVRKGGERQRNIAPRYVCGYQRFDCVKYQEHVCFVFGRRSTCYFDLRMLDGTKVHASASVKKLQVVQKASACLIERKGGFPPTAEAVGILPKNS